MSITELLLNAGIKIPAGATSYHTSDRKIIFIVSIFDGKYIQGFRDVELDLTDSQIECLSNHNCYGTFGWRLVVQKLGF